MKRTTLTGILLLTAGAAGLLAQPKPKSKAELDALQAIFQQANNPDALAKLSDEFLTKFADTEFKDTVLYMEADAWHQKRDDAKAQVYAEQALAANPKQYQASILLAEIISKGTRETDLDREEKLTKSDKYAKDAIDLVKDTPKPNPQIPDAQWDEFKKGVVARAHGAIGIGDLARKKYAEGAAEFKTAYENDPQPAYLAQQASALQSAGKNDEAIALCDKILADPQMHPAIKNVATQVRAAAVKAGGKAPGGGE